MSKNMLPVADKRLIPENITSLLVPLQGRSLLLPSVSVAEMAPYIQPRRFDSAPVWLLGSFPWRNQQVPLLSFESLSGDEVAAVSSRSRVAVLNNTGINDQLPFIAILTQGIPRLAHVVPESIEEDISAEKGAFDLMRVTVEGNQAAIPDLAALEHVYLNWLSLN